MSNYNVRATAEFSEGETPEQAIEKLRQDFGTVYVLDYEQQRLNVRTREAMTPSYVDGILRVDFELRR